MTCVLVIARDGFQTFRASPSQVLRWWRQVKAKSHPSKQVSSQARYVKVKTCQNKCQIKCLSKSKLSSLRSWRANPSQFSSLIKKSFSKQIPSLFKMSFNSSFGSVETGQGQVFNLVKTSHSQVLSKPISRQSTYVQVNIQVWSEQVSRQLSSLVKDSLVVEGKSK